jgi:hypothetical protein
MISLACREVAKHAPLLLPKLGPRNGATEEVHRNGREKMCPNVMPQNEPRNTCISEWDKLGISSSFISSGCSWHIISKRKKTRQVPTSSVPAVSAKPHIDNAPYCIEGGNPPNLTGKIQRNRRKCPLSIERQKKREMSARKFTFL